MSARMIAINFGIPCVEPGGGRGMFFHGGGAYDQRAGFEGLAKLLEELEAGAPADRLFFLSVPPTVFGACATHVSPQPCSLLPAVTHAPQVGLYTGFRKPKRK